MNYAVRRKLKKLLIYLLIAELLFIYYRPEYIKKMVYPFLYAQRDGISLKISAQDVFYELSEKQKKAIIRFYDGNEVIFLPQVGYSVTAKVGIMERYDGWWENFYHKHKKLRMLYNKFSPLDLALFYGRNATKNVLEHCQLEHEYRGLFSCSSLDPAKYNNYHIVPANNSVAKGMETVLSGDVVYVEGFLVHVKHPFSRDLMHTGTAHKMIHPDQFVGGQYTEMCFILYTTKLIVDGFEYE